MAKYKHWLVGAVVIAVFGLVIAWRAPINAAYRAHDEKLIQYASTIDSLQHPPDTWLVEKFSYVGVVYTVHLISPHSHVCEYLVGELRQYAPELAPSDITAFYDDPQSTGYSRMRVLFIGEIVDGRIPDSVQPTLDDSVILHALQRSYSTKVLPSNFDASKGPVYFVYYMVQEFTEHRTDGRCA